MSWGACLLGALNDAVWIGFSVSVTSCVLAVLISSPKRRIDFLKVGIVIALGMLFEAINARLGLYSFIPDQEFPPAWLLSFWPAFSIMFIEMLKYFYNKPFAVKFLAGFVGGAGYWAGEWLGLIRFHEDKYVMMFVFALVWSIEFIALLTISRTIDKSFPASI
jgi:hypothetical protein